MWIQVAHSSILNPNVMNACCMHASLEPSHAEETHDDTSESMHYDQSAKFEATLINIRS